VADDLAGQIAAFLGWLAVEKGYSPHTVANYGRDLAEFAAQGREGMAAAEVDPRMVRAFVYSLHGRNKSSSVARKLSALRTFFRYLLRRGIIARDPAAAVAMPKQAGHIPVFLTVDEVFSLLESPGPADPFAARDRAILEMLYSTGMRVAELAALNLERLDLAEGMVRVLGKGNKERLSGWCRWGSRPWRPWRSTGPSAWDCGGRPTNGREKRRTRERRFF